MVSTTTSGAPGVRRSAAVLLQLLALQVVYVAVGVGFGRLCQNTPLAVVTYLVVTVLVSSVVLLVPLCERSAPGST